MTGAKRQVALVCLVLSVLVCAASAVLRTRVDAQYKDVMVLVDWQALNALPETDQRARLGDKRAWDVPWSLLSELPGAMLCYSEETVSSLAATGILRPASIMSGAPAYEVVNEEYADDIAQGSHRHGYWMERSESTGGKLVVRLPDLPADEEQQLPVCWRSDVIGLAKSKGVQMILRPGGQPFLGAHGLQDTLAFCAEQPLVLFNGPSVLGYPDQLNQVAAQLDAQKQDFGWIEFDEQDGGAALAAKCSPRVVRVHSIPADEMPRYDITGAASRLLRAAAERSIRCLYVRPFPSPRATSSPADAEYSLRLYETNKAYFALLNTGLEKAGLVVSDHRSFLSDPPELLRLSRTTFAGIGVASALVILLALWGVSLPVRGDWGLISIGALGGLAAHFSAPLLTAILLGAGIIFPLLGFWAALSAYRRATSSLPTYSLACIPAAAGALGVAGVLSIAGGVLIHGAMWDVNSMLHIEQYRGVTLALALPVLLLAAYAWQAETLADAYEVANRRLTPFWQRLTTLWESPIRYGDVAFILIAMGILGIVLLRSGNESAVGASGLELSLRNSLEGALAVRPRTKELFGNPALILFLTALPLRNRFSLLLALGGMLGQVSILNTFCHIHTPLGITVQRVLLGLCIGAIAGSAISAIWLLGLSAYARLRRKRIEA